MQSLLNNIHNKDCMELFKEIPNESIDLVCTDCPYKIKTGGCRTIDESNLHYLTTDAKGVFTRGYKFKDEMGGILNKRGLNDIASLAKNGKMFDHNEIKFSEWLPDCYRVLKKGTHCYIMVNNANLHSLLNETTKVGFVIQNILIWDKGNATPNQYYMQATELIVMLSKRPARNINDMGSKNIVRISNIIGNKQHPTEKPVELMEYLVKNSTNKNDIVLDMFAGAGSTLIASKNLERQFIGCEIDKKYYDIAVSRLNNDSRMFNTEIGGLLNDYFKTSLYTVNA